MKKTPKQGMVHVVGAGPGGGGLLTRRGYELLQEADVVVYDYLVDKALLRSVDPRAEMVCCADLGKSHAGTSRLAQTKIQAKIIQSARRGKNVVRLKNGDPFIFGRLNEEIVELDKARVRWDVLPGVTSASQAAMACGISLTDRVQASSVVFTTGREAVGKKSQDWASLGRCGTIVLYMAVETINSIASQIVRVRSRQTPVAIVVNAGGVQERVFYTTLQKIGVTVKKEKIQPPAIFIIGQVAARPSWVKRKEPCVLVTSSSVTAFKGEGRLVHIPLIDIKPLPSYRKSDAILRHVSSFSWVIFTSRHAVDFFFQRLMVMGLDARNLAGVRMAVMGEATAERLKAHGVKADHMPQEETSRGLVASIIQAGMSGKSVLMPGSLVAGKTIAEGLVRAGAKVTMCPVYANRLPRDLPKLDLSLFDQILFASPSGVRNFKEHYGKPPRRVLLRSIGPVTQAAAKNIFGKGYRYVLQDV